MMVRFSKKKNLVKIYWFDTKYKDNKIKGRNRCIVFLQPPIHNGYTCMLR